jgi:hypothetical protein
MTDTLDDVTNASADFTVHLTDVCEGMNDYLAATGRVEFRDVDENFDRNLLVKVLNALPSILPALGEPDGEERVKQLCQAFHLDDPVTNIRSELMLTGRAEVERFFKTTPLLSEDEVRQLTSSNAAIDLSALMRVTYDNQTFYFADQFEPDGSTVPQCIEYWKILNADPTSSEWDNALWWISNNGWIRGSCTPREVFSENPANVRHAAEQEALRDEY